MESLLAIAALFILALAAVGYFIRRANAIARDLKTTRQELVQARAGLRQMIEQRDLIAQSVDEGILLIDAEERIAWMNPVATNILGAQVGAKYSLSEITWGLQIQPLVREILQHRAESLGQTVVKDDRTFQVSVRAFPADSEHAAILLLHEVTELQRLGRVRRDFVANISHELRTPVTSLRLLTDTLSKELTTNPTAAEWIAKLRQQVDVLQQLAEEMMGLALIESGQMPIRLIETRLIDLVDASLKILRAQAAHKQIEIEIDVPQDLCALADPEGIRKVINNLLHNAIKFTPPQGRIVVRARPSADNIEIEIADNGIGIPARDLPRIFERFYKSDQARSASGVRGTGLGLAIAKHIVEGHGGKIWAESVEGKGSTFYFTLPACER